jgi:hypothetical protein
MHVGRLIHQTFGQQRVQAAFDIYNVRPLKVKTVSCKYLTVLKCYILGQFNQIEHLNNSTVCVQVKAGAVQR